MAKIDGFEIRFGDASLDALLILTAALNNFAAAMNAAAEASSSFSFSVSNNCALVVKEVDDEPTH